MSERPRAPLFTAKPDDVVLHRLCSGGAATAPPTAQWPNEVKCRVAHGDLTLDNHDLED